jgi:hypothetical protein
MLYMHIMSFFKKNKNTHTHIRKEDKITKIIE